MPDRNFDVAPVVVVCRGAHCASVLYINITPVISMLH